MIEEHGVEDEAHEHAVGKCGRVAVSWTSFEGMVGAGNATTRTQIVPFPFASVALHAVGGGRIETGLV